MPERELKLSIGEDFVVPDFVGQEGIGSVSELPAIELGSVYYDTPDLRLARHGVSLAYRIGEPNGPHWQLNLPPDSDREAALDQDEFRFDSGPAEVPAAARQAVAAWIRRAPLAPSVALKTRRRRIVLLDGDGHEIADVAIDEVTVLQDDQTAARFRELAVAARGGSHRELGAIGRLLQQAGAGPVEPISKYVRALGSGVSGVADVVAQNADVAPENMDQQADIATAIGAAIAADVSWLVRHHAPTILGDPEGLHRMRVAARRLRSDLITFDSFLDQGWTHSLDVELEWLGDLLAAVRNGDVWGQMIEDQGRDLGPGIDAVAKDVARQREVAWETLAGEMGSSRFLDLVDRLVKAARAPLLREDAHGRAGQLIEPEVLAAAAKVGKSASRLSKRASDRDFHRVRIRVKRLRYAAETALPYAQHRRALAVLATKAKKLQDVLGMLQDAVTLRDVLDRFSAGKHQPAGARFVAGKLAERQETIRLTLRGRVPARLRALRKAIRAWEDS